MKRLVFSFSLFASATSIALADDIQLSGSSSTPRDQLAPFYKTVEGAATYAGQDPPFANSQLYPLFGGYNVTIGSGTGAAVALAGQQYLAYCVNLNFGDPDINTTYTLATDGSNLSYDPDGAGALPDFWTVNTTAKFDAIRDIVAAYSPGFATLDQNSAAFQQKSLGMALALWEVTADYNPVNGISSLSLITGDNQIFNADGSPFSLLDPVYENYLSAISFVGSGAGVGTTLYAVGSTDPLVQDMILIQVPEPSGSLLLGTLALAGMVRRKRSV